MGFGDKLKELRDQAQQAVSENKDRIQDAVQVAGDIANTKTRGKYADKIGKVGTKVEAGIDKFADGSEAGGDGTPAGEAAAPEAAAPEAAAAEAAVPTPAERDAPAQVEHDAPPAADTGASGFPDFE